MLRQLPGAAVAPLALAAAGAADVLGGVRAHLAPHTTRDHADKWRRPFTGQLMNQLNLTSPTARYIHVYTINLLHLLISVHEVLIITVL